MILDKIIVTVIGIIIIGFIYWYFFGKKEEAEESKSGEVAITVSGGYKPAKIKVKANQETKITFTRTDNNSCLEDVYIPDFSIKEYLPLNIPVSVTIKPEHKGEYDLHCGMNMYHAKIIVT
jgi:plastocyanin domain-containing protein